ncbi:hypothetical protein X798_05264, partial [Onchocerca flexuosa]
MDLTVLSEQQLQQFVRIVAEDFKIKYKTLQRLHDKEAENTVSTIKAIENSQKNVRLESKNISDNFSILYNQCNQQCCNNKDKLCKLCIIK